MPSISIEPGEAPVPLRDLPYAQQEAIAIADRLETEALTGDRATKSAVLSQLPHAKLVHLATHGLLEDFGSGVPGAVALAPDSDFLQEDSLLGAGEILALDLNAELVVLSACDTGRGKITGDGVVGLSRSFLTAGAKTVVVSLWAVDDESTAQLMQEFYRNWQQTGDTADALRQAMLSTMVQYPTDPSKWAAFTVIGQ